MDKKEKIKQIMKLRGPLLPSDIYKAIETDLLMTGALLSELSSNRQVLVSYLKVGGSPVYYLPDQRHMLQNFLSKLNEKDQKTYQLLKEKKVLRDDTLDSLTRVSLRNIRDFAVPLKVKVKGQDIIFWKWYLLDDDETEKLVKSFFEDKQKPKEPTQEEIREEHPSPKPEQKLQQNLQQKDQRPEPKEQKIQTKEDNPQEPKKDTNDVKQTSKKDVTKDFLSLVLAYFKKNKIEIVEKISVKRSELDFIVEVPSAVGTIEYFCRSKNKKKVNDSDIAAAYVQSQQNKLPLLLVITGETTKKADKMLQKEFKGTSVKQI